MPERRRTLWIIVLIALTLLLAGCAAPPAKGDGDENAVELSGGALATFDVDGETFKVWVTNPNTIEQLRQLQAGESLASIPNGVILKGTGEANHNAPWSWHLDPEQIEMAEAAIEVCDARPTYVEDNVAEFVDNIKRYCPWQARLTDLQEMP